MGKLDNCCLCVIIRTNNRKTALFNLLLLHFYITTRTDKRFINQHAILSYNLRITLFETNLLFITPLFYNKKEERFIRTSISFFEFSLIFFWDNNYQIISRGLFSQLYSSPSSICTELNFTGNNLI